MTLWDDRILELLYNRGPMSVGELGETDVIRVTRPHVSRRCKKLAENGLLNTYANGVYDITEEGERYLNGEIDADTFREIEQDDDVGISPGEGEAGNGV
jgi:Mn-dependent DtxR family transcriptional regulator